MSLRKWVNEQGGVARVAARLGVTRATIYYWLRGWAEPSLKNASKIVTLSRGKVCYRDLLRYYLKRDRG